MPSRVRDLHQNPGHKLLGIDSTIVGGRDWLDGAAEIRAGAAPEELTVLYTDKASELSGTLQTSAGGAVSDVFVIAFATERTLWGPGARRVQAVRPAVDGHYVMQGLPPGEYFLTAVTDIDQNEWEDPAFLSDLISSALQITIDEGENKVQDLRLAGG